MDGKQVIVKRYGVLYGAGKCHLSAVHLPSGQTPIEETKAGHDRR